MCEPLAMDQRDTCGPLYGTTVLELPGLGPVPFAGMLLADLGADVVRVDRCEIVDKIPPSALDAVLSGEDTLARGRRRIALDLKDPVAAEIVRKLAANADILLEGFRPGVAERLGLGPDDLLVANPRLIYARVTGWGQDGPLAHSPGHEINYLAVSGTLASTATAGTPPAPPLGSIGDLPGGGMLAVLGILAALVERAHSGRGQVIDASILDGTLLTGAIDRFVRVGDRWGQPGSNSLDGGSHFYRCYRTADNRAVSFGALEPNFHENMLREFGIDPAEVDQFDETAWPTLSERIQAIVETGTAEQWCERFNGVEACFAPVLTHEEAASHPQVVARSALTRAGEALEPSPAPRMSRTPLPRTRSTSPAGADTALILDQLGISPEVRDRLLSSGSARQAGMKWAGRRSQA